MYSLTLRHILLYDLNVCDIPFFRFANTVKLLASSIASLTPLMVHKITLLYFYSILLIHRSKGLISSFSCILTAERMQVLPLFWL